MLVTNDVMVPVGTTFTEKSKNEENQTLNGSTGSTVQLSSIHWFPLSFR